MRSEGSTPVERKAIQDSALAAGARKVQLIEEPIAAAIGAGLPISEATGSMVVDIGGGTTDSSNVFRWSCIFKIFKSSRRYYGWINNKLYEEKFNLLIGDSTAEKIKKEIEIGCSNGKYIFLMKGRDIRSGTPKRNIIN